MKLEVWKIDFSFEINEKNKVTNSLSKQSVIMPLLIYQTILNKSYTLENDQDKDLTLHWIKFKYW